MRQAPTHRRHRSDRDVSERIGLRGEVLVRYAEDRLLDIEDISDFVRGQEANAKAQHERLVPPSEQVYPVADTEVAKRLGVLGER